MFCIGPLTIVGSIEDGLGDPELLLVKSGLDGFASIAFAAVYGWGVGLSALTIAVIQGGIALGAGALDGVLTDPMVDGLGAAGGICCSASRFACSISSRSGWRTCSRRSSSLPVRGDLGLRLSTHPGGVRRRS